MIYENSEYEKVEFGTSGRYRLLDVTGLGGVEYETRTVRSPYQDGETYIESIAKKREVELVIGVYGNNAEEVHQYFSELAGIFSAKLGEGTLQFEYAGKVRKLRVSVDRSPTYLTGNDNRTENFIRTTVELTANDPYWRDAEDSWEELQTWVDEFHLPASLPTFIGSRGESGLVTNGGQVDTPLQIIVEGGFTPPLTIENVSTGETITITQELEPDETLFINTTAGNQRVYFLLPPNGTEQNAFHYLDPSSRLFQLQRGINEIRVNAQDNARVVIGYNRRYESF